MRWAMKDETCKPYTILEKDLVDKAHKRQADRRTTL
jgi:hypothetical protein